jgi:hypothetical protein
MPDREIIQNGTGAQVRSALNHEFTVLEDDLYTNVNGVEQLVKTDSEGKLPAIDGSNLTNIAPSIILWSPGTYTETPIIPVLTSQTSALLTDGQPLCSSYYNYSSWVLPAYKAFDGIDTVDPAFGDLSAWGSADGDSNKYLGFTFLNVTSIDSITIMPRQDGMFGRPYTFELQYTDNIIQNSEIDSNGVYTGSQSWTFSTGNSFSPGDTWVLGQSKTFNVTNSGQHKAWRIKFLTHANDKVSVAHLSFNTLQPQNGDERPDHTKTPMVYNYIDNRIEYWNGSEWTHA